MAGALAAGDRVQLHAVAHRAAGGLALFGVFGSVLNGLGKQWLGLRLTAAGFLGVMLANWLLVRGVNFGPELLTRTALATSSAVVVTALASGLAVQRLTGGGLRAVVFARVSAAVALCVVLGQCAPAPGKVATIGLAAAFGVAYLVVLVLLREVTAEDWRTLRGLAKRRVQS